MGDISQLKTWVDQEVLTHTDLNSEFQQLINTINDLGNDNWASAGVDNLDGTKITLGTNTTFLAEHSAAGIHSAIAGNNMDNCFVDKTAADTVQIKFDRINVYDSDTISSRVRKLIQSTGTVTLNADIGDSGANGLDTGAVASSTVYYIWVIYNATTGTAASLLSLAATIAGLTLPSGYTYAKLVGRIATDTSGDFLLPRPIVGASFGTKFMPFFAQFATGEYAGTGAGLSVTGLDFDPSYVIVQRNNSTAACHRSDQFDDTNSAITSGTWIANGITAINPDGFTVGTHASVSSSGSTHHWMAWKISVEVNG